MELIDEMNELCMNFMLIQNNILASKNNIKLKINVVFFLRSLDR